MDKLALVATAIYLVTLQIPVLTNVVIIVMSLAICLLCVLTLLCVISAKPPTIKKCPFLFLAAAVTTQPTRPSGQKADD